MKVLKVNKFPRWIEGISIYCEWLYETNQAIIKLSGLDCINDAEKMRKLFLDVSHNIVKLVPCEADYVNKKVRPVKKDGIYNFIDEIKFLDEDYKSIFFNYNNCLYKIKIIRNKTEHEPHNLKMVSSYSGSSSHPNAVFEYDSVRYNVRTEDFIEIVILLNAIFDKLIKELEKFKYNNNDKYGSYPYLEKYTALNFEIFNRVLKSDLLADVGKIMKDF